MIITMDMETGEQARKVFAPTAFGDAQLADSSDISHQPAYGQDRLLPRLAERQVEATSARPELLACLLLKKY